MPSVSRGLTVPVFLNSLRRRSSSFLASPSSMAILTWTSLVLIKSTTTPYRSSVPKIPAKNPCETLLRFELTFRTMMCSLMVTAVGALLRFCSSDMKAMFLRVASDTGSFKFSAPISRGASASTSASGKMTVPPPFGFSTFFILMGIFFRMAYIDVSISVNSWSG